MYVCMCVSACVYVCACVCTYACNYVSIWACMYAYGYTHTCICACVGVHTCTYIIQTYLFIYLSIYIFLFKFMRTLTLHMTPCRNTQPLHCGWCFEVASVAFRRHAENAGGFQLPHFEAPWVWRRNVSLLGWIYLSVRTQLSENKLTKTRYCIAGSRWEVWLKL